MGDDNQRMLREVGDQARQKSDQPDDTTPGLIEQLGPFLLHWLLPAGVVVLECDTYIHSVFPPRLKPGSWLHKVDGFATESLADRNIVLCKLAQCRELHFIGPDHVKHTRAAATAALRKEDQASPQVEDLGVFKLQWVDNFYPTIWKLHQTVLETFSAPVNEGDVLRAIDDYDVIGCKRGEILDLLANYRGLLSLRHGGIEGILRVNALQAIGRTEYDDPEWVGPLQLSWKSMPPTIAAVAQSLHDVYPYPVQVGESLHTIDGVDLATFDRVSALHLMANVKEGINIGRRPFQFDVARAAYQALRTGGAAPRAESLGPFRFMWGCPPLLLEVEESVRSNYSRPLNPGDSLSNIDGHAVANLGRTEILNLFATCTGNIGFRDGTFDTRMRCDAERVLERGPSHDSDWVGPLRWKWDDPPEIVEIDPNVHLPFQQPVSVGDTLHSICGRYVTGLGRVKVLELMVQFNGGIQLRMGRRHQDIQRNVASAPFTGPPQRPDVQHLPTAGAAPVRGEPQQALPLFTGTLLQNVCDQPEQRQVNLRPNQTQSQPPQRQQPQPPQQQPWHSLPTPQPVPAQAPEPARQQAPEPAPQQAPEPAPQQAPEPARQQAPEPAVADEVPGPLNLRVEAVKSSSVTYQWGLAADDLFCVAAIYLGDDEKARDKVQGQGITRAHFRGLIPNQNYVVEVSCWRDGGQSQAVKQRGCTSAGCIFPWSAIFRKSAG